MRMASPPTRASLTSSTRMSRTVESSGSVSRAASSRAASIAWRKVAYSVWPPQFTAHYARAPGAAPRGAASGCPSPVPRFRYRPRRRRRPDGRARARAPGGERARQHRASGAGDQRLPRRARGAHLAVVEWEAGGRSGGAEAVARLARTCDCTTVRVDGGDEMQGTLLSNFSFGLPAIAAMNAFGIDVAAIGNHEFDWSVDTLRARMAGAKYRFLAANITDSTGAAGPDWATPWTLIERGGLKVAAIGLALRATPTNTAPRNVRGLAFGDGAAAVRRVLPRARAAADFVLVVAHEGAFCDGAPASEPVPAPACHGEILDIARGLDSGSVDLIVSGHTHSLVNTVVNGIPIVQARSSGAGIAVVDFVRVHGTGREVRAHIETPYADQVRPDAALADTLRPY